MSTIVVRLACVSICLVSWAPVQVMGQRKREKEAPLHDGRLIAEDNAGLFSPEAIRRGKSILSEVRDTHLRELEVFTMRDLSESKQKEYAALADSSARERFFADMAREEARESHARGVFVLISRNPHYIIVLADRELRDKGFTAADEQHVRDAFVEKFRESEKATGEAEKQALRDKGLINAAEYVRDAYKKLTR